MGMVVVRSDGDAQELPFAAAARAARAFGVKWAKAPSP
jgi:hypothetical protein